MNKWLLFTTGGGSADPINWDGGEAALYSANDLKHIKPNGPTTLDLVFQIGKHIEVVTLGIKNRSHSKVISAIANAIEKSNQSVISIADLDGNRFISPSVYSVSLSMQTYIQTLANNTRTLIQVPRGNYNSCLVANTDASADVQLTLELHDGSTYTTLFSKINIPVESTLKLETDEISFDNNTYNLYATSSDADGQLTFTFNY